MFLACAASFVLLFEAYAAQTALSYIVSLYFLFWVASSVLFMLSLDVFALTALVAYSSVALVLFCVACSLSVGVGGSRGVAAWATLSFILGVATCGVSALYTSQAY